MTFNKPAAENTNDAMSDEPESELLEWRDLQNAQITSMMHVWDNPEDEVWNDA